MNTISSRTRTGIKHLTLGVALSTLAIAGTPTSGAATTAYPEAGQSCALAGPFTTRCQTGGSSQIYTAPNPTIGIPAGTYGPFFRQNRGLGGAAAIGAAGGR